MKKKMLLLVLCITGAATLNAQSLKMVSVLPEQVVTTDRLTVSGSFNFNETQLGSEAMASSQTGIAGASGKEVATMETPSGSDLKNLVVDGALVVKNLNIGPNQTHVLAGKRDGTAIDKPQVRVGALNVAHVRAADLNHTGSYDGRFISQKTIIKGSALDNTWNAGVSDGAKSTGLTIGGKVFPSFPTNFSMYWVNIPDVEGGPAYALVACKDNVDPTYVANGKACCQTCTP